MIATPPKPVPRFPATSWSSLGDKEKTTLLSLYMSASVHLMQETNARQILADMAHLRRMHMHGICQFYVSRDEQEIELVWATVN